MKVTVPLGSHVVEVMKDGVLIGLAVDVTAIAGSDWFSASFYPTSTGIYDLIVDDVLVANIEVVTRNVFSFLGNIEDQALGSWEWDKTTKVMTLHRQDGSLLGTYDVDDNLETAHSRLVI